MLAAQLAKTAAATHSAGWESEALMLQAESFWMQSCPDQALGLLSQAVSLAEPRGFIRLFVDEGYLMDSMLKHLSTKSEEPCRELAAHLLNNFAEEALEKEPRAPGANDATSSPLSNREIEVLLLVAAGLSNPKIAEHLVVSTATIKTHVSHIYAKLDAQNRAEAVARAKEKGLI
jgi:LuxR family maltose regulon positive regulatory protein